MKCLNKDRPQCVTHSLLRNITFQTCNNSYLFYIWKSGHILNTVSNIGTVLT